MFDDYSLLTKTKQSKIRFDPFVFTGLVFIAIILCLSFICLVVSIYPVVNNFNILIADKIPNEIEFYHELFMQHNQTIVRLESKIEKYIDVAEIVVQPKVLEDVVKVIYNIKQITSNLNITLIQDNISQIQNDLNAIVQIIKHLQ